MNLFGQAYPSTLGLRNQKRLADVADHHIGNGGSGCGAACVFRPRWTSDPVVAADSIPLAIPDCPPSYRNTVRHAVELRALTTPAASSSVPLPRCGASTERSQPIIVTPCGVSELGEAFARAVEFAFNILFERRSFHGVDPSRFL
jgi:hypothetical protein